MERRTANISLTGRQECPVLLGSIRMISRLVNGNVSTKTENSLAKDCTAMTDVTVSGPTSTTMGTSTHEDLIQAINATALVSGIHRRERLCLKSVTSTVT